MNIYQDLSDVWLLLFLFSVFFIFYSIYLLRKTDYILSDTLFLLISLLQYLQIPES